MSKSGEGIQVNADIERLEETIIVLEAQRAHLGDQIVDTALDPLREKLAALQKRQDSPAQQRKFVTILFADMTGWTAMSQRLELEDMLALTDGAIRRFNRIVERRGGRVLKFLGDGLMAVFGLPQVQEDDAERAVQAGLDILASAKIYAQVLEERWGLRGFNVRVGANTGPIILGGGLEEERSAVGMTVNLASRMESTAPSGTLRITHATYQQIRGLFEIESQPLLHVKGKDQPLLTYLVKAARRRSFHMERPGIPGIKTPLIGRESEMEQLVSFFRTVEQEKKAHLITIVGDPGIGKSRLMREFDTWLSQQPSLIHIFYGRGFRSLQDSPYGVLRMMIAQYCQIHDSDEVLVVRNKLESHLARFFAEDSLLKIHFIGALLGYNFTDSPHLAGVLAEPRQLRDRALHYLSQFFVKATEDGPTVILFEDIHWADEPTIEVMQELAKSCAGRHLFILCLARPDLLSRYPKWPGISGTAAFQETRLDLAPLTHQASHDLLEEILKQAEDAPISLAETIVDQADGNPFHIEELIMMLIDNGIIIRYEDSKKWRIDLGKLEVSQVPGSLTAVLLSRLGNLPPGERTTLQYAAVAGRSFWNSLVTAVSGRSVSLEGQLSSLVRRDLIFPKRESTFAGEQEYAFKHTLLREAIYETILLSDRRQYHGRVADWLGATTEAVGRKDEFALLIAEHYDLAEMLDLAADYYLRAGERANRQGVSSEALRSLNRALNLMREEETDRHWQAMLAKEVILGRLGRIEEQLAFNESLVDYARKRDDDVQLAEAYYRLGYSYRNLGQHQQEAEAYKISLEAAQNTLNHLLEANVSALLSVCLLRLGKTEEAKQLAREALQKASDLSDDSERAQTLTNIASFYSDVGDIAEATRLFIEIVDLCSRSGMVYGESINRINLGYNYTLLGQPELGSTTLEAAIRLTSDIGAKHNLAYCRLNLGLAYLRAAKLGEAQSTLEKALSDLKSFGDQFGQAAGHFYLGLCLEKAGRIREARERFSTARKLFIHIDTPGYMMDASAGIARCFLFSGDLDQARMMASQVWEYLLENSYEPLEFPGLAYLTCVESAEAQGEDDQRRKAVKLGYNNLMQRAEKIADDAWRQSFLHDIDEHQALILRHESLLLAPQIGLDDASAKRRSVT